MPNDDNRSLAAWAASDIADEPVAAAPAPVAPVAAAPEPVIEPVAEPVAEVPEPVASTPAIVTDDDEPEAKPEPEHKPEGSQKKPKAMEPWMKDRLAEQTAKQREAERQATEAIARQRVLEAELETLRRRPPAPDAAEAAMGDAPAAASGAVPAGYVPAERVQEEASRIAAQQSFDAQANAAYHTGKESYSDFDEALQPLQAMGAIQRRDFQEAALATDAASDVLYHLGSNPNEASKILGFLKAGQSAKAVSEMTKIAMSLNAEKAASKAVRAKPSAAPAPIRPVGGSALPSVDLEKASDEEFTQGFDKMAKANGWY
jgi:hypothetical protein